MKAKYKGAIVVAYDVVWLKILLKVSMRLLKIQDESSSGTMKTSIAVGITNIGIQLA